MVKKKVKEKEIISLTEEDLTNIRNLFSNTLIGSIQDRDQLRTLLNDEDELIEKLNSIQKERDDLLIGKEGLLNTIKKLEKDANKDTIKGSK